MAYSFCQNYKSTYNFYQTGNKTFTSSYSQLNQLRLNQKYWNTQLKRRLSPNLKNQYKNHQDKQYSQYTQKAKYGFLRSTIITPFQKKHDHKYLIKNNQSYQSAAYLRLTSGYQAQKLRNQQYAQKNSSFQETERLNSTYGNKKYTGNNYGYETQSKYCRIKKNLQRIAISPINRTKKYGSYFNLNQILINKNNKIKDQKPYQWLKKYNEQGYLGKSKSSKYQNTYFTEKNQKNRFSKKTRHYQVLKYNQDKTYSKNDQLRQTTSNTQKNNYDFLNYQYKKPLSSATTIIQDIAEQFLSKDKQGKQYLSTSQTLFNQNKLNLSKTNPNQENKIIKNFDNPQQLDLNAISANLQSFNFKQTTYAKNTLTLNDFVTIKALGQGKFGNVSLVLHKATKFLFALKKIKKDQIIQHKLQNQFLTQVKIQIQQNHPNILGLYGFFDDQKYVYLILQYAEGGSLYDQLKKEKVLSQQKVSKRLRQVLLALNQIHSKQIGHRDLKPQNIVLSNSVCKLCDFGSSAQFGQKRRKTLLGSLDYIPTQVLKGYQYGLQIDLWCLGVLTYQLLVGKTPFYNINLKKTLQLIRNANIQQIYYPNTMTNQAKNFIKKLIVKQPQQRMDVSKALQHIFIKKYEQK